METRREFKFAFPPLGRCSQILMQCLFRILSNLPPSHILSWNKSCADELESAKFLKSKRCLQHNHLWGQQSIILSVFCHYTYQLLILFLLDYLSLQQTLGKWRSVDSIAENPKLRYLTTAPGGSSSQRRCWDVSPVVRKVLFVLLRPKWNCFVSHQHHPQKSILSAFSGNLLRQLAHFHKVLQGRSLL